MNQPPVVPIGLPILNNETDTSSPNAGYVESAACDSCHRDIGALHRIHGHSQPLTAILGASPPFPDAGLRAGVPDPPSGFAWPDVSYVLGGYTSKALFMDGGGFFVTTGATGVDTQWNLAFPPNGTS